MIYLAKWLHRQLISHVLHDYIDQLFTIIEYASAVLKVIITNSLYLEEQNKEALSKRYSYVNCKRHLQYREVFKIKYRYRTLLVLA